MALDCFGPGLRAGHANRKGHTQCWLTSPVGAPDSSYGHIVLDTIVLLTDNLRMAGKLARDTRGTKPFPTLEGEAVLNVLRTAEFLLQGLNNTLKDYGLTFTQFNLLRILRGAGESGFTCSQLAERLISRDPDMTRLLDRMEHNGLLKRERSSADRRIVLSMITPKGDALLKEAEEPMRQVMREHMSHLGKERLLGLVDSLEEIREVRD